MQAKKNVERFGDNRVARDIEVRPHLFAIYFHLKYYISSTIDHVVDCSKEFGQEPPAGGVSKVSLMLRNLVGENRDDAGHVRFPERLHVFKIFWIYLMRHGGRADSFRLIFFPDF